MVLLKRLARAAAAWAAANPAKTAELVIALAVLGHALLTTRRLHWRALRRAARVLL